VRRLGPLPSSACRRQTTVNTRQEGGGPTTAGTAGGRDTRGGSTAAATARRGHSGCAEGGTFHTCSAACRYRGSGSVARGGCIAQLSLVGERGRVQGCPEGVEKTCILRDGWGRHLGSALVQERSGVLSSVPVTGKRMGTQQSTAHATVRVKEVSMVRHECKAYPDSSLPIIRSMNRDTNWLPTLRPSDASTASTSAITGRSVASSARYHPTKQGPVQTGVRHVSPTSTYVEPPLPNGRSSRCPSWQPHPPVVPETEP